jgi:glycopeptide antibiotics resistance protein
MKRMLPTIIRISFTILFLVYLYFLARVILFKHFSSHIVLASILDNFNIDSLKRQVIYNSNFIPLKTIINYVFYEENQNIAIQNILGNIIVFVPFGFLLPLIVTRRLKIFSIVTLSFLLSLVLELVQISGIGSFDVDDLILNTFGALLGFRILNIFTNFRRGISRERNQPLS